MNEMGPEELMGSELGLPGEEELIETRESTLTGLIEESCIIWSPSLFPFPLEKIYIFCQVFHELVLRLGHTVMLACTYTHKHNDVCTLFLPKYIIISTLHRLCGVRDSWMAEDRRKEGDRRRVDTHV